jgi:hypothetical protein
MAHCWVGSQFYLNVNGAEGDSTFPFSQRGIMEMQCELLTSDFKEEKTIALVKDNIRGISDGSSSHCAGALQLGLEKAFELKKKRQVSGVEER